MADVDQVEEAVGEHEPPGRLARAKRSASSSPDAIFASGGPHAAPQPVAQGGPELRG